MRARDLGVCDVIYFFPTLNGIDFSNRLCVKHGVSLHSTSLQIPWGLGTLPTICSDICRGYGLFTDVWGLEVTRMTTAVVSRSFDAENRVLLGDECRG